MIIEVIPKKANNIVSIGEETKEQILEEYYLTNRTKDMDHDIKKRKSMIKTALYTTHFNIFLYATAFWIQTGVLPFLSKKLAVNLVTFGYLQTTFSVIQLIGGPIYGRYGDLFGTRAALLISYTGAVLMYGMLAMSSSIALLFLSRLPSVLLHAMHGSQMIVSDCSSSVERAGALGKLGLSYGVGMIIGPLLGGIITRYFGEQAAAFVACALSAISIVNVFMFIPSNTKELASSPQATETSTRKSEGNLLDFGKLFALLRLPGVSFLIMVKLAFGFPIGVFNSMFAMVAIDTFKLSPDQNGLILALTGVLGMIVQGFFINTLTRRFDDKSIVFGCIVVEAITFIAMHLFTHTILGLCVIVIPLVIAYSISGIIFNSALTKSVPTTDNGAILGLSYGADSFVNAIAPLVGGYLMTIFGWPSIGLLGFVVYSFIILMWIISHGP